MITGVWQEEVTRPSETVVRNPVSMSTDWNDFNYCDNRTALQAAGQSRFQTCSLNPFDAGRFQQPSTSAGAQYLSSAQLHGQTPVP